MSPKKCEHIESHLILWSFYLFLKTTQTFSWFDAGVVNTHEIEKAVKKAIDGRYPLYNLGFGSGVDYGFLERMALENKGLARRIYPDSDAALQLQVQ